MERVATILHIALQITANLSIVFGPFLPFSMEKLNKMLAIEPMAWDRLGALDLLEAGHVLGKPELLFEKIEDSVIEKQVQKLLDTKKANEEANYHAKPIRENIAFDDFTKLDIRVGTILECTKVPKADKLLQFRIDDGLEKKDHRLRHCAALQTGRTGRQAGLLHRQFGSAQVERHCVGRHDPLRREL